MGTAPFPLGSTFVTTKKNSVLETKRTESYQEGVITKIKYRTEYMVRELVHPKQIPEDGVATLALVTDLKLLPLMLTG